MTIAMYGMGPVFPDRFPDPSPSVSPGIGRQALPYVPHVAATAPIEPESVDQLRVRLEARVAWLENELRMHEAWTTELSSLKTMLAAFPVRAGDLVRKRGTSADPVFVSKVEGTRIWARWSAADTVDMWIDRSDVVLVERSSDTSSGGQE